MKLCRIDLLQGYLAFNKASHSEQTQEDNDEYGLSGSLLTTVDWLSTRFRVILEGALFCIITGHFSVSLISVLRLA